MAQRAVQAAGRGAAAAQGGGGAQGEGGGEAAQDQGGEAGDRAGPVRQGEEAVGVPGLRERAARPAAEGKSDAGLESHHQAAERDVGVDAQGQEEELRGSGQGGALAALPSPLSAVQTRPCPSLRFPQPHRGAVQRAQKNKANREAVAAAKKKARAKKQALDKEEKKRAAEQQEEEEPETEWIQCDKCKKWRTIPNTMAALLDDTATTSWSCSMNTWDP